MAHPRSPSQESPFGDVRPRRIPRQISPIRFRLDDGPIAAEGRPVRARRAPETFTQSPPRNYRAPQRNHRAPRRNSNVARDIGRQALANEAAILAAVRAEEALNQEAARINDAIMQKAAICRAYGLWGEIE